jgi:cytochrome c-type biogenesis protein
MTDINFFVAFTAGLFSFLSPCVLPLIPSYLSFVSGVSLEEMRNAHMEREVRRRVVLNSLAFIFGFSLVFVSLGASASYLGSLFLGYRGLIRIVGGVFVILVGVYLMGLFKIATLERYFQFNLEGKPAGYLGSVLVGITFAVAWTPCVGPILGAILALAGTSGEIETGIFLLMTYAAGLALPFFLSAVAVNSFFQFSQFFRRYLRVVHVGAGALLVVVGMLLLTGYITILNSYAISLTPEWLLERL